MNPVEQLILLDELVKQGDTHFADLLKFQEMLAKFDPETATEEEAEKMVAYCEEKMAELKKTIAWSEGIRDGLNKTPKKKGN